MRGYYVVKESGRIISVSPNLITNAGKIVLADSLASRGANWAGEIGIGAGSTAADAADRTLSLEFARSEVNFITPTPNSPSAGKYRLTAKASLDEGLAGVIHELGLFSNSSSDEFVEPISSTNIDEPWFYRSATGPDVWTDLASLTAAWVTGGNRVGAQRISLNDVTAFSSDRRIRLYGPFDFSDVQSTDRFCLGVVATTGTAPAMNIRFYTDDSNFFSYAMPTISSSSGYRIFEYAKSNWTATGSPNWADIQFLEINTTSTLVVTHIDAIRVKRVLGDPDSVLVSRSIPSSPITKSEGTPLEIEYYVDLF